MKIYSSHWVKGFEICLGYQGYVIKEYFVNYSMHMSDMTFDLAYNRMEVHEKHAEPCRVTLVDTGSEPSTGGRLKRVFESLGDETFCITSGDGVYDDNLRTKREMFHEGRDSCWRFRNAVERRDSVEAETHD